MQPGFNNTGDSALYFVLYVFCIYFVSIQNIQAEYRGKKRPGKKAKKARVPVKQACKLSKRRAAAERRTFILL